MLSTSPKSRPTCSEIRFRHKMGTRRKSTIWISIVQGFYRLESNLFVTVLRYLGLLLVLGLISRRQLGPQPSKFTGNVRHSEVRVSVADFLAFVLREDEVGRPASNKTYILVYLENCTQIRRKIDESRLTAGASGHRGLFPSGCRGASWCRSRSETERRTSSPGRSAFCLSWPFLRTSSSRRPSWSFEENEREKRS